MLIRAYLDSLSYVLIVFGEARGRMLTPAVGCHEVEALEL